MINKGDGYTYFYTLFQIAECKREIGDTSCKKLYKKFVHNYYNLNKFIARKNRKKVEKMEGRLSAKIADQLREALIQIENYRGAEDSYKIKKIIHEVVLTDKELFHYAYVSFKQNRFGQASQILQDIKNKQPFEPSFSTQLNTCIIEKQKSIVADFNGKDTLFVTLKSVGCYHYRTQQLKIIKGSNHDYFITLTKQKGRDKPVEYRFFVGDTLINQIQLFENSLRNFSQYNSRFAQISTVVCDIKCGSNIYSVLIEYDGDVFEIALDKLLRNDSLEIL